MPPHEVTVGVSTASEPAKAISPSFTFANEPLANAIFSSLNIQIAILDGDGLIVDVNDAWTQFAVSNGGSAAVGVGANYFDVCRTAAPSCVDAGRVLDGFLSVINGAVPRFQYAYRCDSPTEMRWYVMTVLPRGLPGQGLTVVHQNDTEMHLAETRYGELLNGVRAIIWRTDAATLHTTFASSQTAEILGLPADDWIRQPDLWQRQIHPDDRDRVLSLSSRAARERRDHTFEYRMTAADGRVVWLKNIVKVVVDNDSARDLVVLSIDITDRKAAERERNELARALLDAQEKERAAIARELHDDLGASVTLLALKLTMLGQQAGLEAAREDLAALHALTGKLADDIRRVSRGLHPPWLELVGVGEAIRQLCDEMAGHRSIAIRCEVRDIPPALDRDIAICLFRVAQEGLRNVLKHSGAKNVSVLVCGEASAIRLQITDDGSGFNLAAARRRGGLGLASIEERLRLVRGTFTIGCAAESGTCLDALVPLP